MISLISCSSDDDNKDEPDPEYYNPIEGKWIWDKTPTVRTVFTNEFQWKYEHLENGVWGHPETRGVYTIDKEKSTFTCKGVTYRFDIIGDKLSISNSSGESNYTKYKEE